MKILDYLEGKPLPQDLGSACAVLITDFWYNWEEYEEACSYHGALVRYVQNLGSSPSLETITTRNRLGTEVEEIQNELSLVDADMARL